MRTKVIKPKDRNKVKNEKSLLTPIVYLILGGILAFKSNEAVQLLFYIIGIILIIYGLKFFILYYQIMNVTPYKNFFLSIFLISTIFGILLIILSNALEVSIRYILGFFLIFIGVTKLLTSISFGKIKDLSNLSSIILIALGIFNIFVSNVLLVLIGWILIADGIMLIWEYLRKDKTE